MHKIKTLMLLVFCVAFVASAQPELPEKHPLDETTYERLVLENGLRVLLVSDPKLDKASAAMAVGVGSLSDPEERQGLAHITEHMLFLGTEKYPDASEYGNYLKSNGGYSNAYTSGDHTNYHFEVFPFAYEGALDRFAQFFIAPLFSQEYTDREKNAVNSEHQKNLENDSWRTYQLWRNHYNPAHPANHFSTGDLSTLGDIKSEEFINFHKQYYSANQMALSLVAPNSIAEMKGWVETYFSEIENQGVDRVHYPTDYILPAEAFRVISIEPIKDLRKLSMEFPMPTYIDSYDNKSFALINYIIGYEGKGSLLSALKAKGWASTLSANFGLDTLDYASLFIEVGLTPAGLENYREIVKMVLGYVELMKDSPYPEALFVERKTMARLEELYANKGEGTGRAVGLANSVLKHPLETAERINYIWTEPDEDNYFELLGSVNPSKMMVSVTAKGLGVDKTEPIYGTQYAYSEEAGEYFESLKTAAPTPEMTLPEANPFIPQKVQLLSERPVKIIDEPGLQLYYSQDQEFLRPKAAVVFKIRHPEKFPTLEHTVWKQFYADAVEESLNELAYPARMAGLGYSVRAGTEGLYLSVSGYNESATALIDEVIDAMLDLNISEDRFEAIKDRTVRSLENFPKSDAWRLAREAKQSIFREVYFAPEARLEVAKQTTLDQVKSFGKKLFKKSYIEALIHGNITRVEAEETAYGIKEKLGFKAISREKVFENGSLVFDEPTLAKQTIHLEVSNSAYWSEYALGADDPKTRAAALMINNFVAEPYYTAMRTEQQLGYIVWSFAGRDDNEYTLYFIIQSGNYAANVLQERSEAFIKKLPGMLQEVDDAAFEKLRSAAIAEVEQKSKSISEKASKFFELIYELDLDFDRQNASLKALKTITKKEVVDLLSAALDSQYAKRKLILAFGREHEGLEEVSDSITNVTDWKKEQQYE